MMPFERRGSDRNREGHGRGARGGIDPVLRPSVEPLPARVQRRTLWLIVPIAALLVVLGVQAAKLEPIAVLQITFAALFAVGVGWIVFALASPRPERVICPACARPELVNFAGGVHCRACGWNGREHTRRDATEEAREGEALTGPPSGDLDDEFDVDELARRLRGRGTLGDPPHRW